MPRRLVSVPLERTWHLRYRWPIPAYHNLPIELEYLSAQELEDRFSQLNTIVGKYYPTPWPNFLGLAALSAIFTLCAVNLGVVSTAQGSCFVIPITLVLWARIRKEVRDRAIKKFKRRSQKLLRTWTADDSNSYAVQWKLRLRTVTRVKLTREPTDETIPIDATDAVVGLAGADNQHQHQEELQTQELPGQQSEQQRQPPDGSVVIPVGDISSPTETGDAPETRGATRTRESLLPRWSLPRRPSRASRPQASLPPPNTLPPLAHGDQQPTSWRQRHSSIQPPDPSRIEAVEVRSNASTNPPPPTATTLSANIVTANTQTGGGQGDLTSRPAWQEFMEALEDLCCCFTCTRSTRRVWMVEISLRECLLDEYALTIPSPVYRDYRLPQYDEIMQPSVTAAPTSSSQPAYTGLPPAYESESEAEDDDDDDEDDDDQHGHEGGRRYQQPQQMPSAPSSSLSTRQQQQQQQQQEQQQQEQQQGSLAPQDQSDPAPMRQVVVMTSTVPYITQREVVSTTTTERVRPVRMDGVLGSMVSVVEPPQDEGVKTDSIVPPHQGTKQDHGDTIMSREPAEKTFSTDPSCQPTIATFAVPPEKEENDSVPDEEQPGESSRRLPSSAAL